MFGFLSLAAQKAARGIQVPDRSTPLHPGRNCPAGGHPGKIETGSQGNYGAKPLLTF